MFVIGGDIVIGAELLRFGIKHDSSGGGFVWLAPEVDLPAKTKLTCERRLRQPRLERMGLEVIEDRLLKGLGDLVVLDGAHTFEPGFDGLMDASATICGAAGCLFRVGHDACDQILLGFTGRARQGQGSEEHLLLLPGLQTGLGGDFHHRGDRRYQVHLARVPEGRGAV